MLRNLGLKKINIKSCRTSQKVTEQNLLLTVTIASYLFIEDGDSCLHNGLPALVGGEQTSAMQSDTVLGLHSKNQ